MASFIRDDFCPCYLTDYSYFALSEQVINDIFEGGVKGFSYFSLILSYFIYFSESSLFNVPTLEGKVQCLQWLMSMYVLFLYVGWKITSSI